MQNYKVNKLLENEYEFSTNNVIIKEILIIKENLEKTKSLQDKYYSNYKFLKIVNLYDPFKKEKHKISNYNGTQNVTNAWIKCFEILNHFNLIDNQLNNNENKIVYFDNASFPGSFILAVNHYFNSYYNNIELDWYASSYLCNKGNILNDSFNLYKNYKNRWLMNKTYNGDVRDINNILYWKKKLGNSVNLYTSDLGFEVNDYNNQEKDHIHANYGQIYSGLMLLKNGGNLLTKQYTFFENLNINIIGILTILFEEVYITKPLASKIPNSEIYIIGKKYKGPWKSNSKEKILINKIKEKIINFDFNPIITININSSFIKNIINLLNNIYSKQIYALNDRISWFNKIKDKIDIKYDNYKLLKPIHDNIIKEWYKKNIIKKNSKTLNVKNIY